MHKKICHRKYRILFLFPDGYDFFRSVFAHDHTVDAKRDRHPLVLLDPAVIMGIKICKSTVLIQRILFQIQTRGIDVRA